MSMSRANQGIVDNRAQLKGLLKYRSTQRSRGIREAKESSKMNDVSLTWERRSQSQPSVLTIF